MTELRYQAFAGVLLLLGAGASCTSGGTVTVSCDAGCADAMVCWFSQDQCVPVPDDAGRCPSGYVARDCATGSCPTCRDCVPACLPKDEVQ